MPDPVRKKLGGPKTTGGRGKRKVSSLRSVSSESGSSASRQSTKRQKAVATKVVAQRRKKRTVESEESDSDPSDDESSAGGGSEVGDEGSEDEDEDEDVGEMGGGNDGEEESQVYTGSTMSISEQAYREKEKECDKLSGELHKLRSTILELRHVVGINKSRGGGAGEGKNKTRKKKETQTLTDKMNCSHVCQYWKKTVWPHIKILDNRWPNWSTREGTTCMRVMKLVTVPALTTPQEYWRDTVCGFINDKICALRSSLKEEVKKQYNGMWRCY